MKKQAPQPKKLPDIRLKLYVRPTPPQEPFPRYTGELDWRTRQKNFLNHKHTFTKAPT